MIPFWVVLYVIVGLLTWVLAAVVFDYNSHDGTAICVTLGLAAGILWPLSLVSLAVYGLVKFISSRMDDWLDNYDTWLERERNKNGYR